MDYYPRDVPRNFLFRGSMPTNASTFAYQLLVDTMETVVAKQNLTLPKNFSLIDISYLNVFEESDLKIEKDFFKSHPELGSFEKIPIYGTLDPPPQEDLEFIKSAVKLYIEASHDQLPRVMQRFHSLLTQQPGPVLIFTHCEAGTDRTGEVSGAYYLKHLNMTFSDALYIDNHVQHRDMYKTSRNALQWYCFYLKFVEDFSHLNCLL